MVRTVPFCLVFFSSLICVFLGDITSADSGRPRRSHQPNRQLALREEASVANEAAKAKAGIVDTNPASGNYLNSYSTGSCY